MEKEGATVKIIAPKPGEIKTSKGAAIKVDASFLTETSVCYDAVFIPGGKDSAVALSQQPDAIHFVNEAYKHCKAIAADGDSVLFLQNTFIKDSLKDNAAADTGILINKKKLTLSKPLACTGFGTGRQKEKCLHDYYYV